MSGHQALDIVTFVVFLPTCMEPNEKQTHVTVELFLSDQFGSQILFFGDACQFLRIPRMVSDILERILPSYLQTTTGSDF